MVAVDDYTMPSVGILFDFLQMEDEWEKVRIVQNTAFFRKLREPFIDFEDDWQHQKINLEFKKKTFDPTPGPFRLKLDPADFLKNILNKLRKK